MTMRFPSHGTKYHLVEVLHVRWVNFWSLGRDRRVEVRVRATRYPRDRDKYFLKRWPRLGRGARLPRSTPPPSFAFAKPAEYSWPVLVTQIAEYERLPSVEGALATPVGLRLLRCPTLAFRTRNIIKRGLLAFSAHTKMDSSHQFPYSLQRSRGKMEWVVPGFPDGYVLEGSHAGMCSELGRRSDPLACGTFPVSSLHDSTERRKL